MTSFYKNLRIIPTRHGIALFVLLTAYFLIMRLLGLAHIYWLRTLNIFILFFVVRSAILTYRSRSQASYYDDFKEYFQIGARTSFIGAALFAIFIALYLDQFDPAFFEEMKRAENTAPYITPVSASALIFIEGLVSGMTISFVLVQYIKNRTVEKPLDDKTSFRKEVH